MPWLRFCDSGREVDFVEGECRKRIRKWLTTVAVEVHDASSPARAFMYKMNTV